MAPTSEGMEDLTADECDKPPPVSTIVEKAELEVTTPLAQELP